MQSHFLSQCYQAPLLGVLFGGIPTQIIADLPGTFWNRFVFVLFLCDNICYLKEGVRKNYRLLFADVNLVSPDFILRDLCVCAESLLRHSRVRISKGKEESDFP